MEYQEVRTVSLTGGHFGYLAEKCVSSVFLAPICTDTSMASDTVL
jgi:hypothetical protein